jgi:ATP-dependent DNA helicase DinG
MADISDPIEDILGENGRLSRSFHGFEYRPAQVQMAILISEVLRNRGHAIVEAGTGTGKTMGYLVPIILSNKKTVISTGTKTLQEQIFLKDIPLISRTTGLKVDSLMMKGRKNYLCLHRYHQYISLPSVLKRDKDAIRIRAGFDEWLKSTIYGDRAELPWLADDDLLWDAVSSTSEQCQGSECIHREACFLNALRKRAAQAQIIIVNHHLFFADIMVKQGGFGEIIPRFQAVVFDEAHNIEEIATNYFGLSLSTGQLAAFVKDVEKETGEIDDKDRQEIKRQLNVIRGCTEEIHALFRQSDERGRLNGDEVLRIREGPSSDIRKGLNFIQQRFGHTIASRAADLGRSLEIIFSSDDPDLLNWYEKRERGIIFHSSPLDVSRGMSEMLYDNAKTIVFTSATLSTNGNFDYIRSCLGISENALEGIYPSHFDFKTQSMLYIPDDLPAPNSRDFALEAGKRIMEILMITSGRALILFTSYSNMDIVYDLINGRLPYTVFRQGDAPRSILLERFREDTHSVLLATGSFWQGVDVPGEALSCLIVDKLPFDSPGDPLVSARIESIYSKGGNPFMEYQLPSAIISLKQGLGRLIRKRTDRGVLAILDVRMLTERYGRFFFNSLPDMNVSNKLEDIQNFFSEC